MFKIIVSGSSGSKEEKQRGRISGRPAQGAGDVPSFEPGSKRRAPAADDLEWTTATAVHLGSSLVHPVRGGPGPTAESGVAAASAQQAFGDPVHRPSCF